MHDFPWPEIPGSPHKPVWDGLNFKVGDELKPVLCYEPSVSGWTDALTEFHESHSGDDHVMDRSSRRIALAQVLRYTRSAKPVILEVGCSSGFMLRRLRAALPEALIIGADFVGGPLLKLARSEIRVPLLQFDLVKCPLPDNSVDCVVSINVLEHIENDQEALRQVARILKPGGVAVIEVPAGPQLYDFYDGQLLHFRRYSMPALLKIVEGAGLHALRKSHLGFLIYSAFRHAKKKNQKRQTTDAKTQSEIVAQDIRSTRNNPLMNILMGVELALGRWVSYPVGVRCLVTCRKPL